MLTNEQLEFFADLAPHHLFQLMEDIYFINGSQMKLSSDRKANLDAAMALGLHKDNGVLVALEILDRVRNSSF